MNITENHVETPSEVPAEVTAEAPNEVRDSDSSFRTLLFGACAVVFVILVLAGYDGSRDLARLTALSADGGQQ